MSTDPVFSDIQKVNPSAIIELFTLTLDNALHGATTVYRFHAGTNLDANGKIVWAGNEYLRFPVQATGFAYQRGQLPRPTLTVSNMGSPSISAILLTVNQTTAGNDLTGAKVVRIRTMARFLDAANFSGATNPFGTPDPTAEFPQEIYYIDRKKAENREIVSWELAAVFDLAGIRSPKRQCTRSLFPSIGTFNQ
jgi:lambda family phage minor tail protein L